MPNVRSKNLGTFAVLNMAKILRSTAGLLENTKKVARETTKGRTPPHTKGSDLPTAHSPPVPLLIRDQHHGRKDAKGS